MTRPNSSTQIGLRGLALALATTMLALPGMAHAQAEDACAAVDLSTPPAAPVPIRYGLTGGGEEPLALLWADRASYPNNGLFYDIQPTLFAPTDRIAAFQAGQLDAGTISLPAQAAAVFRGINAMLVATLIEVSDNDNQGAFVVLSGGDIGSVDDLEGRRVGYYGPNTISEYWVRSAMNRAGLDMRNVSFVALPPPAQEQALRNRQIDVAWLARQFLARATAAGGVDVLMTPHQAVGGNFQPSLQVFFSPAFVEANPQAYCAWRADFQMALENWANDRASLYPALVEAGYVTPASANAGPDGGRAAGGMVSISQLDATIADMVEVGFMRANIARPATELVLHGWGLITD